MSENLQGTEEQVIEKVEEAESEVTNHLGGQDLVFCMIGLLLSSLLAAIDQTISVVITSDVESDFKSFGNIGWLVTGYTLPVAVLSLNWGRISFVIGNKTAIVIAVAIFEIGSLICALSNSMNLLIGGRVISGIGGGGIQSLGFLIITDIAPLDKRARLFPFLAISFVISSVIGPLIGGAFSNSASLTWRWCFYINLPFGGVAIIVILWGYKVRMRNWEWYKFKQSSLRYKFFVLDTPGIILLLASTILLLLGLSFGGNEFAWNSQIVICCFVIGGCLLMAFLLFEFIFFDWFVNNDRETETLMPLIPYSIFKNYQILSPILAIFFENCVFAAIILYGATYYEIIIGLSPLKLGIHLIASMIPVVISAIINGIVTSKTGYLKPFILFGGVLSLIGSGIILLLDENSSNSDKIGFFLLPSFAFGFFIQSCLMSAQAQIDDEDSQSLNIVTSAYNFGKAMGSSVGSNLATAIFTAAANHQKNKFEFLKRIELDNLTNFRNASFNFSDSQQEKLISSLVIAMKAVFYMALAFSAAAFVTGIFTSNKKVATQKKGSPGQGNQEV